MCKKIFFLFLLFPVISYAQISFSSLIYDTTYTYKYFIGNSEPDAHWKDSDFNDESWNTGYKSIGYGDGDDSIIIDPTTSLYLRYTFNIDDTAGMKTANMIADFDDGYVAYLNGTEVVRINLGKKGDSIPFDRLTDRSHEAIFYRDYFRPLCSYLIDSTLLKSCLKPGKNVLTAQVHNDSINGSDLSFSCDLFINMGYNFWNVSSNYIKQVPIDSTQLPIIVINTNELGIPVPHVRYVAHMEVINRKGYNKPTDTYTDYSGRVYMELRGKSSVDYPKKSFNIETQDSEGNNLNVPLLGMPEENDWIMFGPFADRSQIRNEIVYSLGRKQGHYTPRTRFCEFILNGDNMGLYILTEKIKQDKKRVNIADLNPDENAGDSLTGGYLFNVLSGIFECIYPKTELITASQTAYWKDFISKSKAIINSTDFLDETMGYKKYIDEQSLIDNIIINEFSKNCDAYYLSTFMYKDRNDRDGRLKYGPLWDYDLAFGNATYQNGHVITGWQFDINRYLNIAKYLRDTVLANQLAEKWHELRTNGYLHTDSLNLLIDSLVNVLKEPLERNNDIWRTIGNDIFFFQDDRIIKAKTYDEEISNMKNWLFSRIDWIDSNIDKIYYYYPYTGVEPMFTENSKINVYPNPFNERIFVDIFSDRSKGCILELFDQYGRLVHTSQIGLTVGYNTVAIEENGLANLTSGIYLIHIKSNNQVIFRGKIMKVY